MYISNSLCKFAYYLRLQLEVTVELTVRLTIVSSSIGYFINNSSINTCSKFHFTLIMNLAVSGTTGENKTS